MSAVQKAAGYGLYLLGFIAILFVIVAINAYMQAEGISKDYIEKTASKTLGVAVSIGEMKIDVEKKQVRIKDVKIANPAGYKGPYAATAQSVLATVDTFEDERMTFNMLEVEGMKVFLEVNPATTNLNDLRMQAEQNVRNWKKDEKHGDIKVMIRNVLYKAPQITPAVTIQPTKIAVLAANDWPLRGIGTAENGVSFPRAVADVTAATVQNVHLAGNQAELFKGMTLETMNSIGVSTYQVFSKNVNKKINKDLNEAGKLLDGFIKDTTKMLDESLAPTEDVPAPAVEPEKAE
ncbi:MAG: hypothetical protein IPH06_04305 [Alphaproteobacteria bacterium]|jgi:hypothetical protein|nr:hypothetical protein [Alphaproteobacteria bacterium]QQS57256.1 MAG: hypothetical protein IPN28_00065 [Alphaproteobacteria bacterium]